ncbi:hypothetical protein [Thalassovita taeanensis]|uniref:Conserved repeat domain-containing protein n=1 Tax=Thalassovita taeanensis TaxID=657014 RepID=A0A1H9EFP4_9RHOB|nr:hypothetical protein [Thalassovita taeanensis]SEQ23828.1 conserved repeat domain-containing protein [Thalassovita taeanensis]
MSLRKLFNYSSVLALASVSVLGGQAYADGLTSTVAFKVVEISATGEETLAERNTVRPGEVIQYVLTHSNEAETDMSGLAITAPIPEGGTVELGSETSSLPAVFEIQAEMEPENPGLEWSSLPAFRTVVDADGTERREPVPADAIAAVRWNLESALTSGETALNTYRVVVN